MLIPLVFISCKNTSTYPITDFSLAIVEDDINGKWKMIGDPVSGNFYEVYRADVRYQDDNFKNQYHLRFWNRGGTNPTYEANFHCSKINEELFINLPYWQAKSHINHQANMNSELYMRNPYLYDTTLEVINNDGFFKNKGYIFLRILEIGEYNDKITAAIVGDTHLRSFESQTRVYEYVAENMNNPNFYSDTIHLYKIDR